MKNGLLPAQYYQTTLEPMQMLQAFRAGQPVINHIFQPQQQFLPQALQTYTPPAQAVQPAFRFGNRGFSGGGQNWSPGMGGRLFDTSDGPGVGATSGDTGMGNAADGMAGAVGIGGDGSGGAGGAK